MTLPEVTPNWTEFVESVAAALSDPNGRIYLDANVLIHCYEMNVAASEALLRAMEAYGDRVWVPAWAAKETWDYTTKRIEKRPLAGLASRVGNELARFQKESTRYIDNDALRDGTSKDEFLLSLASAVEGTLGLIKKVQAYEPKADQTTARLIPFIDGRLLPSDLTSIIDEVARTGALRMANQIPPGFGDSTPAAEEGGEEPRNPPKPKGKQRNPHGDLIIWLEILQDCVRNSAEHIVLVTKDLTKGDWVYVPHLVFNDRAQPQRNNGLVTLPLPLLKHEAKRRSPTVTGVHIISVEMLARVLQHLRVEVGALAAALQAETEEDASSNGSEEVVPGASGDEDAGYIAEFGSTDMVAELSEDDPVDQQIRQLNGEGWRAQNKAARRLAPLLRTASRLQRIQIGRGLVEAANDGAVEPIEILARILGDDALGVALRSDLLIGVLAEIYIDDAGVPKKPNAPVGLTELIYRHESTAGLQSAYRVVRERLQPQARKFLALPGDHEARIPLTVVLEGDILRGVSTPAGPLLEEAAPQQRALLPGGLEAGATMESLIELLAKEFVVPAALLEADQAATAVLKVPALMGFVAWGPKTGAQLR